MLKVENVATPFTAGTVAVHDSVPLPGLLPIATVTLPVKPVTVFPSPSCAVTWTPGAIAAPAVALDGCTVNTSRVAAAAVTANAALDPPPAPPHSAPERVYPVPALSRLKSPSG